MGGVGEKSVEFVDFSQFSLEDTSKNLIPKSRQKVVFELPRWKTGPSMPDMRARGCSVAKEEDEKIYVIGTIVQKNGQIFVQKIGQKIWGENCAKIIGC